MTSEKNEGARYCALGASPGISRGRAHGACAASARREEEAMSMRIVDDEQRAIGAQPPRGWAASRTQFPSGSGGAGASAALALLDDVHRHRLRRAALHLPPPGQERVPFYYSDRLLAPSISSRAPKARYRSFTRPLVSQ